MNQPFYEKRLNEDLKKITKSIAAVGTKIDRSLKDSLHALLNFDRELAYHTILGDNPINREVESIDKQCHYFVARHLPSAGHLRFVSSVMRINIELERVGDYAVTISREAVQLSEPLTDDLRREIEHMARSAFQMFNQSVRAFKEQNVELAKGTIVFEENIDSTFSAIFALLVNRGERDVFSTVDLFSLLAIVNMLERVSDQAKNICEETIFSVTGESKIRKPVRILFLDKANDLYGPMATSIARKAFPNSGIYVSAGSETVEELRPDFINFMDRNGYSVEGIESNEIQLVEEEWAKFKVIISLRGEYQSYISKLPFHSVALNWELPDPPSKELPEDQKDQVFTEILRLLAHHIQDLMTLMRGEEAS